MKFEVGQNYHGFILDEERKIDEVNSVGRLFHHEKSGARLFSLENDDDNKVFSITFRTPPEDSTGLPHILEHSVLCGSRKFPVKEPFVELIKGSLNTFLNAMTFSDKTMYPVASKNEKDFFNLMDVYLDAVFYPNIYKYPEIFMQEGWHYELDNKDGEINLKGVVYNEMKGAFSTPERLLFSSIQESLFPDTPYGRESGGDPDVIPKLTLERFLAFHKKYYHPSNSYIYLYGNGNLDEELKFIDEGYLRNFDRLDVNSAIPLQKPFNEIKRVVVDYPVSPDESEEDKAYLSMSFAAGRSTDPEIHLGMEILEHMLMETPAAPLKKALIDAGIGKDVFGQFDNSILEPVFSIIVKNTNPDREDEFRKVVIDTLRELVNKGIDKKLIEASINLKEFELREAEYGGYPKGLVFNIVAMDSWLHDKAPWAHLQFEPTIDRIKSALTGRYFEGIIERYLLNNTHGSIILLKPQKGLAEKRIKEIRAELDEFKSKLDEGQLNELVNSTNRLRERQSEPDSPGNLAKLPMLSLKDINPEAERLPLVESDEYGVKVLHHPVFTNKIVYFNMYFDGRVIGEEFVSYAALLGDILTKVSTKNYDYTTLTNNININTGGMEFNVLAFDENGDSRKYYPKFVVKSKSLTDKLPELLRILREVLENTRFDERKRLLEIIQEVKSRLEMRILEEGHVAAARRLNSYFSPSGRFNESVLGISYYKFICGLTADFENRAQDIAANLKHVYDMLFVRKNLILSITCEDGDWPEVKSKLPMLLDGMGNKSALQQEHRFEPLAQNEGLLTQAKVQYVAKGYNFLELGYSYSGVLRVLRTIVGYDYLWNNIRVKGGAYGAFARFDRNGNMIFSSYRDPNLRETLDVYDGMEEYLRRFDAEDREMTKYIIGTVSSLDFPLTPSMKGERAAQNYISHITYEDTQRERDEVLKTRKEDIRGLADMVSDAMKQGYYCVLGSDSKIKSNKDLFNNLINVFDI